MKIRHSNWGHVIGLLVALFGILIIVSFFKITWDFWLRMYEIAYR